MLSEELKGEIRRAYNAIIEGKSLRPRWGQRQMIAEVANSLARIPGPGQAASGPAVCVVEAGTGTGKTIAYAVAAIPIARALNKRLVVATATVALQEQFVNKDLPDIRRHSGLDFSFALAKGGAAMFACRNSIASWVMAATACCRCIPMTWARRPAPMRCRSTTP